MKGIQIKYKFLMNLRFIISMLFSLAIIFSFNCGGGKSNDVSSSGGGGVTIKGSFSETKGGEPDFFDKIVRYIVPMAYALDLNSVKSVIVINTDGEYTTADVTNGTFSIEVGTSQPVGIIFAGSDKSYKGYLTLTNGINSLPLSQLKDGVAEIDLGTLTASGSVIEPSHNPVGSAAGQEINLTDAQKQLYAQMNSSFSASVITPDADNNGLIDLLENKSYHIHVAYYYTAGTISGSGTKLDPVLDLAGMNLTYNLVFGGSAASTNTSLFDYTTNAHFTGPSGSGVNCDDNGVVNTTCWVSGNIPTTTPPVEGSYVVTNNSNSYTMYITRQSNTLENLILLVPSVTLNSNGTLNKINWEFKTLDNTRTIENPFIFIEGVKIQMNGSGSPCTTPEISGQIYSSGANPSDWIKTLEHTFKCQNIQWTNVNSIMLMYWDIFGTQYTSGYNIIH